MTIKEVAELLKASERTLYRLVRSGCLPAFKLGGMWRFRRSDIDAWIERQIQNGDRSSDEWGAGDGQA